MVLVKENVPMTGATITGTQSPLITNLRAGKTLVDKVVLYNFFVKSLTNSDELVKRGFLHYEHGRNHCSAGNDMISKIVIHDNDEQLPARPPFHTFFYGMSLTDHFYCRMELLVNRGDGTYNLFGNTPDEVRAQVKECQAYLSSMGIEVEFYDAKIYSAEVNRTIIMIGGLNFTDPEFQCIGYRMLYDLPGTLRLDKHSLYKKRRTASSTFMASSVGSTGKGLTVKLYDKTAELKKKYKFDTVTPYMRLEITISGSDKIKDTFGSNYLRDLTEAEIDTYFTKFTTENIKKAHESINEKLCHKMAVKIKKLFPADRWHWAYNFILWIQSEESLGKSEYPIIMGVDEIYNAIDSLNRGDFQKKGCKPRMKNAIDRVINNPLIDLAIYERSVSYWNEFIDQICTPAEHIPDESSSDEHDATSHSTEELVDSDDNSSEPIIKSAKADSKRTDDTFSDENSVGDGSIVKTMINNFWLIHPPPPNCDLVKLSRLIINEKQHCVFDKTNTRMSFDTKDYRYHKEDSNTIMLTSNLCLDKWENDDPINKTRE